MDFFGGGGGKKYIPPSCSFSVSCPEGGGSVRLYRSDVRHYNQKKFLRDRLCVE